jgi:hypothetical protein
MNYSTSWHGDTHLMSMEINGKDGVFTGSVRLYQDGKGLLGCWNGGSHGIGTQWDTQQRAINGLCAFMIFETEDMGIKDKELKENIAHGSARAAEREKGISAENDRQADAMLIELKEWSILCQESIKEMQSDFHIPEVGEQMELF